MVLFSMCFTNIIINIFCLALTATQRLRARRGGSLRQPWCPAAASEKDDKWVFGGQSKDVGCFGVCSHWELLSKG